MSLESLHSNRMEVGVGSNNYPGCLSTAICNDPKDVHFGTDEQARVWVDDDGAWLLFSSFAPVAANPSKTAIERRIIRDGRPHTDQDRIVLATEVVGHGFRFGP